MKVPKIRPVRKLSTNLFSSIMKKNVELEMKNRKLYKKCVWLEKQNRKLYKKSVRLEKENRKLEIELKHLNVRLGKLENLVNEKEKPAKMKLLNRITRPELVKILEKKKLSCAGSKTSIQTRVCSNFSYEEIEENVRKLKSFAKDTVSKPKIECSFCGKAFINLKLHLRSCKMKCQKDKYDFNFNQN